MSNTGFHVQGFCLWKEQKLTTGWIKMEFTQMWWLAGGWAAGRQLFRACPRWAQITYHTEKVVTRPGHTHVAMSKGDMRNRRPPLGPTWHSRVLIVLSWVMMPYSGSETQPMVQKFKGSLNLRSDTEVKVRPSSPLSSVKSEKQIFYVEKFHSKKKKLKRRNNQIALTTNSIP